MALPPFGLRRRGAHAQLVPHVVESEFLGAADPARAGDAPGQSKPSGLLKFLSSAIQQV